MNKVEQFRGVANELTSLYEKKNTYAILTKQHNKSNYKWV